MFEIQDDPVAHSIHYNKFLHDLHLHDYKSFSRLTDVSYDDVIKSDDFAVILFTLECKRYSFIKALGFRLYYFVYSSSSSLLRICWDLFLDIDFVRLVKPKARDCFAYCCFL